MNNKNELFNIFNLSTLLFIFILLVYFVPSYVFAEDFSIATSDSSSNTGISDIPTTTIISTAVTSSDMWFYQDHRFITKAEYGRNFYMRDGYYYYTRMDAKNLKNKYTIEAWGPSGSFSVFGGVDYSFGRTHTGTLEIPNTFVAQQVGTYSFPPGVYWYAGITSESSAEVWNGTISATTHHWIDF